MGKELLILNSFLLQVGYFFSGDGVYAESLTNGSTIHLAAYNYSSINTSWTLCLVCVLQIKLLKNVYERNTYLFTVVYTSVQRTWININLYVVNKLLIN